MDPFKINHAASLLFWLRASAITLPKALEQFTQDGASSFISPRHWIDVLRATGLGGYSESLLLDEITREIGEHLSAERQLTGPFYLDEIATGRSLEAQNVDASGVLEHAVQVKIVGSIKTAGILCLRHPLPAVVVADEAIEHQTVIKVASTSAALGVECPLFLYVEGCSEVAPGKFVMTGIFQIPAASQASGQLWDALIQNSSRFLSELRLVEPSGATVEINVSPA